MPDQLCDRFRALHDAGADVLYAPGLADLDDIGRLVRELDAPVNVLALPRGPSVAGLAAVGVRRVSTGGSLAMAAHGALVTAARELLDTGTSTYAASGPSRYVRDALGV